MYLLTDTYKRRRRTVELEDGLGQETTEYTAREESVTYTEHADGRVDALVRPAPIRMKLTARMSEVVDHILDGRGLPH